MSSLSAEAAEENAFAKRYLDKLAEHPVTYPDDFVTPAEKRPRRMPALSLDLGEPPAAMDIDEPEAGHSTDIISITVKSLKPSLAFPVKAHITDSVADLKQLVSSSTSSAPPASAQRLLLKGKALADAKLLKEYDIQDGAVVHVILKPGWEKEREQQIPGGDPTPPKEGTSIPVEPIPTPGSVPVLTISDADPTTDNTTSAHTLPPRAVTAADISNPPLGPGPVNTSAPFHATLARPEFWEKVHGLCRAEFEDARDADGCWKAFLDGIKGRLSAGEIAKIIDVVGVTGMGGNAV
ncbi:hypothetical protein QFC21_002415 [Naganishia friedmannii]|uniref:Uncharacterized protein n=1 Tax=Naganishia friedmannii TaxID=89922 RepID=A0ACC2VZX9_9TREE|nr:hypothetical protein QFC21_002415 [Naganishia friedmannii]